MHLNIWQRVTDITRHQVDKLKSPLIILEINKRS